MEVWETLTFKDLEMFHIGLEVTERSHDLESCCIADMAVNKAWFRLRLKIDPYTGLIEYLGE